jgi:hypothetical protein
MGNLWSWLVFLGIAGLALVLIVPAVVIFVLVAALGGSLARVGRCLPQGLELGAS